MESIGHHDCLQAYHNCYTTIVKVQTLRRKYINDPQPQADFKEMLRTLLVRYGVKEVDFLHKAASPKLESLSISSLIPSEDELGPKGDELGPKEDATVTPSPPEGGGTGPSSQVKTLLRDQYSEVPATLVRTHGGLCIHGVKKKCGEVPLATRDFCVSSQIGDGRVFVGCGKANPLHALLDMLGGRTPHPLTPAGVRYLRRKNSLLPKTASILNRKAKRSGIRVEGMWTLRQVRLSSETAMPPLAAAAMES